MWMVLAPWTGTYKILHEADSLCVWILDQAPDSAGNWGLFGSCVWHESSEATFLKPRNSVSDGVFGARNMLKSYRELVVNCQEK